MNQEIKIKAPIKIKPSMYYYLVIEDADGITHYFHHKHKNEYGDFEQGEYDGYSLTNNPSIIKLNMKQDNIDININ